jgi:hypothetical protein
MSLPLLSKNELKLFSNEFKLSYIERHGSLMYFKINDENMTMSVYEINQFLIQVLKLWPTNQLKDIVLVSEDNSNLRCLRLVFLN